MARVSVLLPVRDGAATLPRALNSLFAQTLSDFEIVAVDDGSTDATPEVLAAHARNDARLRVLTYPPSGIAPALNHGLAACRAPYVARMDADDICAPERLEAQVRALDADPQLALIACRVAFGGDAEACAGYAEHVAWQNALTTHEQLAEQRFVESPLAHPSVMFRREAVTGLGGYRHGDFPEDYELWLRMFAAGLRLEKLPRTLLTWSDTPDRLSRIDPRYSTDAFYRLKARHLADWLMARGIERVTVWGAGRESRRRAALLIAHGIGIDFWVDIDPRKVGNVVEGRRVIAPDSLPAPGAAFIVAYVGSRGAGDEIHARLCDMGHVPLVHFVRAA